MQVIVPPVSVVCENANVEKKNIETNSASKQIAKQVNGCNGLNGVVKKPLVMKKSLPAHISRLNNQIDTEVLTNKVPMPNEGQKPLFTSEDYTLINAIGDDFFDAVS